MPSSRTEPFSEKKSFTGIDRNLASTAAVSRLPAAATAFITQTLIGGGRIILMPSHIYQQAVGVQDWPFAAALSLVFTLAVTGIVFAIGALARRHVRGVDAA